MRYFYLRVSQDDQTTDNQLRQLEQRFGKADEVFVEHNVSGKIDCLKRPAFADMFAKLQPGDVLHSVAVDRLGRNTIDVLVTVNALIAAGVIVQTQREGVDFSTPIGQMVLTCIAGCAQLERALISERTIAGLERARSEGRVGGKRVTETGKVARDMLAAGASVADVIAKTGMSQAMVYRIKKVLNTNETA